MRSLKDYCACFKGYSYCGCYKDVFGWLGILFSTLTIVLFLSRIPGGFIYLLEESPKTSLFVKLLLD